MYGVRPNEIAHNKHQKRKDRPRFGATFLAVALFCLVGLILITRELRKSIVDLPQSNLSAAGETTLLLGVIILGSWLSGRLIRRVGLPPITGQLLFGVLVGPSFWTWLHRPEMSLINASQLVSLQGPESLAVVMIGLVAGAEIDWLFLRSKLRVITALAAGQMILVFIAVAFVAFAFLDSISQSVIVATIAATSSSAVSVALLREMRHPTDFARLLLATTVAKDLFLVVAFSVILFVLAATTTTTAHQAWYWIALHLAGSIGVGIALAFPLRWALARIERRMTAVVLVTAIFLAILCSTIGVAPLITPSRLDLLRGTSRLSLPHLSSRQHADFFLQSAAFSSQQLERISILPRWLRIGQWCLPFLQFASLEFGQV